MWPAVFIACAAVAYGNGFTEAELTEAELVNTQHMDLKDVGSVKITYGSDAVKLFRGDSDVLVIKEYMSIDDSDYYARVSYATAANTERQLVIEHGKRPSSSGVGFGNDFQSRVEIYMPASFTGAVAVKVTSGSLRADDALRLSAISLESLSGSITLNDIKSDTAAVVKTVSGSIRVQTVAAKKIQFSTTSGSIRCDVIDGTTVITTASGTIDLKMVTGALRANTASGSIRCAIAESAGDIALSAASGSITLDIPSNMGFHFSANMRSGSLSTPFSDQLHTPFSDRHSATGTIKAAGFAEHELISIDISVSSGSIRVRWI
jgi:hypothetical protein